MKVPSLPEGAALVEMIKRDGAKCPVLLGPAGDVLDGRQHVLDVLGAECPTIMLDIDAETVERFRTGLNVTPHRFSLNDRRLLVKQMKDRGRTPQQIAEQLGMGKTTVYDDLGAVGWAPARTTSKSSHFLAPEKIAEIRRLRDAGMYQHEIAKVVGVSKSTVFRYMTDPPQSDHVSRPPTPPSPPAPKDDALARSWAQTKEVHGRSLLASMQNAPAGKLNLPAIERIRKLVKPLLELMTVDPAKIVSQLPIEACRELQPEMGDYYRQLCQLATERLAVEAPDDLPRLERRGTELVPVRNNGKMSTSITGEVKSDA